MMMTSSSYEPTLIGDEPSSVRGCCANSEVKKSSLTRPSLRVGWVSNKHCGKMFNTFYGTNPFK